MAESAVSRLFVLVATLGFGADSPLEGSRRGEENEMVDERSASVDVYEALSDAVALLHDALESVHRASAALLAIYPNAARDYAESGQVSA